MKPTQKASKPHEMQRIANNLHAAKRSTSRLRARLLRVTVSAEKQTLRALRARLAQSNASRCHPELRSAVWMFASNRKRRSRTVRKSPMGARPQATCSRPSCFARSSNRLRPDSGRSVKSRSTRLLIRSSRSRNHDRKSRGRHSPPVAARTANRAPRRATRPRYRSRRSDRRRLRRHHSRGRCFRSVARSLARTVRAPDRTRRDATAYAGSIP